MTLRTAGVAHRHGELRQRHAAVTAGTSAAVTVDTGPATKLQVLLPGETAPPAPSPARPAPPPRSPRARRSRPPSTRSTQLEPRHHRDADGGHHRSDANATLPANAPSSPARATVQRDAPDGRLRDHHRHATSAARPRPPARARAVTVNAGTATKLQVLLPGRDRGPGHRVPARPAAPPPSPRAAASPSPSTRSTRTGTSSPPPRRRWPSPAPTPTPPCPPTPPWSPAPRTFSVTLLTAGIAHRDGHLRQRLPWSPPARAPRSRSTPVPPRAPGAAARRDRRARHGHRQGRAAHRRHRAAARSTSRQRGGRNWNLVTTATPPWPSPAPTPTPPCLPDAALVAGNRDRFRDAPDRGLADRDRHRGGRRSPRHERRGHRQRRAAAKLQVLLPGETADPGSRTGKTGAPPGSTAGAHVTVTVNAVDAYWNVGELRDAHGGTSPAPTPRQGTCRPMRPLVAGTRSFAVTLRPRAAAP